MALVPMDCLSTAVCVVLQLERALWGGLAFVIPLLKFWILSIFFSFEFEVLSEVLKFEVYSEFFEF